MNIFLMLQRLWSSFLGKNQRAEIRSAPWKTDWNEPRGHSNSRFTKSKKQRTYKRDKHGYVRRVK
jgi:hypothetical protein